MRNYQKAAVVLAMLGSVSFLGAGVGHADGGDRVKINNKQSQGCEQNDKQQGLIQLDDVNVNVGILAVANQDASEDDFMKCGQSTAIGH